MSVDILIISLFVCLFVCYSILSLSYSACDNYNDAICSPYIFEDVKVLVNRSKDTKDGIVRDASNAIKNLSEDPNSLSSCLQLAQAIVCHSVYPYCDSNALLNYRQALARPICNDTCEIFTDGGECSGIIDPSSDLFALLMSNCDASGQVAGDSPECIYISLEAPGKGNSLPNGNQVSHSLS